jgi:hypothetical protein
MSGFVIACDRYDPRIIRRGLGWARHDPRTATLLHVGHVQGSRSHSDTRQQGCRYRESDVAPLLA